MKMSVALLRLFAVPLGVCGAIHGAAFTFMTIDVPGASGTQLSGINDSGQIVGTAGGHGFLYSAGIFSPIDAPFPGVTSTSANGINNAGQIVGKYSSGAGHGFLDSGGVFTTIDVPFSGSTGASASAINNRQQIVGTWDLMPISIPFQRGFLDDGGVFSTIDVGASTTTPTGINDAGEIVGGFSNPLGGGGFVFSNGVSNLFMAPFLVLNLSGVNNAGDLVGNTFITNEGFLDSGGVFSLIDVPGASSTHVFGINNLGQIVGTYTANDGSSHGFLATPIPEPAPPLLLTFALTGILIRAGKLVGSRGGGGMPRLARIRSPCRGVS